MKNEVRDILDFWFAGCAGDPAKAMARSAFWYSPNEATDREIEKRFHTTLLAAQAGECDEWAAEPRAALALVIVLDQFPRNVWRGTARAFSCDALALAAARVALASGHDAQLTPVERSFLLMPFQHSESLATQRESVHLYRELVDNCSPEWRAAARNNCEFAEKHLRIVERFGRFPHRNALLGRVPTAEETAWLNEGGETFGQA